MKPGDNADTIGPRLVSAGVVASARGFVLAAEASKNTNVLEPGFYRLHKHMSAALAWGLLLSPSARVQSKVTIPEGFRVSQTLATLAKDSGISASDYAKAIKNTAGLHLPSYAKGNPEGYLFPGHLRDPAGHVRDPGPAADGDRLQPRGGQRRAHPGGQARQPQPGRGHHRGQTWLRRPRAAATPTSRRSPR